MPDSSPVGDNPRIPLAVDVDGSLVSGDLLIESVFRLVATRPLLLFILPIWFLGGRARLKRRVARAAPTPPATLALNPAVLDEIAAAKAAGREVWLASGSDELLVVPLAESVDATGCLASDGRANLTGPAKAAALVERFGEGGFDYIGNEQRDLAVWKRARRALGVGLSGRLARRVRGIDAKARLLPGLGGGPRDYFQALRPHHWVKNLLVFLPLVAAQETQVASWLVVAGVFGALSVCASGTYLFNDMLDLPHDRQHPNKRFRPLAAGRLPLGTTIGLGTLLMAGGLALAFGLSAPVGFSVLLYLLMTLAYSTFLKRRVYIDIITLAALYAVRVFAGATAVSVPLSPWFLGFFVFVFLALAAVKRQSELHRVRASGELAAHGRAYVAEDLPVLTALGVAAGCASVVVFTLYIQSPDVSALYGRPELLWLVCPLLLYWLGRMTLLANRGAVDDDPVVFALGDRASWLTALAVLVVLLAAL